MVGRGGKIELGRPSFAGCAAELRLREIGEIVGQYHHVVVGQLSTARRRSFGITAFGLVRLSARTPGVFGGCDCARFEATRACVRILTIGSVVLGCNIEAKEFCRPVPLLFAKHGPHRNSTRQENLIERWCVFETRVLHCIIVCTDVSELNHNHQCCDTSNPTDCRLPGDRRSENVLSRNHAGNRTTGDNVAARLYRLDAGCIG